MNHTQTSSVRPFVFSHNGKYVIAPEIVSIARRNGWVSGGVPTIKPSEPKPLKANVLVLARFPGATCARVDGGLYAVWKKSQGGTKRDPAKAIGKGGTAEHAWLAALASIQGGAK